MRIITHLGLAVAALVLMPLCLSAHMVDFALINAAVAGFNCACVIDLVRRQS